MTEDQQWCLDRSIKAAGLRAPTLERLFADAAEDPVKASILRQETERAASATKSIRARAELDAVKEDGDAG